MNKKKWAKLGLYMLLAFLSFTFIVPSMNESSNMAVLIGVVGIALTVSFIGMALKGLYRAFEELDNLEGESQ